MRITERIRSPLRRFVVERVGVVVRKLVLAHPYVCGPAENVHLSEGVSLVNALINTVSGDVWIGSNVTLGHNVSLLTGTHETEWFGVERVWRIPRSGRDIVVEEGVWIASNATVIGPCRIGAHAVVAAGAVVVHDVPAYAIVAGVPARVVSVIEH